MIIEQQKSIREKKLAYLNIKCVFPNENHQMIFHNMNYFNRDHNKLKQNPTKITTKKIKTRFQVENVTIVLLCLVKEEIKSE